MNKLPKIEIALIVFCLVISSSTAFALEFLYEEDGKSFYIGESGKIICSAKMGAIVPNAPDYDWWYGCSPTSAGMLMGYYDIRGGYPDLVAGGVAELTTYPGPGPYIANDAIASSGHIADYWVAYGNYGNDPNPTGPHGQDCLADFMGTSQDNCGNADGFTTFWWYLNGNPIRPQDIVNEGINPNQSGMYGIKEYVEWCGYDYVDLYNQLINPYSPAGFTYAQFMAEIDSCRPHILHIENHTMFAPGYDSSPWPQTVYVHDTWSAGPHTMQWGGVYPYPGGTDHYMITVLILAEDLSALPESWDSPSAFRLAQSVPDPLSRVREIEYNLAEGCHVRLEVFNVLGQRMATLVDEYQTTGKRIARWSVGPEVASGAYFCRLEAGNFIATNKMVVLK